MLFFPSSRARLFFVQELHALLPDRTLWLPQWGNLREVMERVTGIEVVEPLALAGYVYHWISAPEREVSMPLESGEAFAQFLPWALMILRDFDQVDKYRVDARSLFLNIRDLRLYDSQVDYLSPEQLALLESYFQGVFKEKARLADSYHSIWRVLNTLYFDLQAHIVQERVGYEGAVVRMGVEKLVEGKVDLIGSALIPHRVGFVGFNALNACEQVFFSHVQHCSQDARYYWNDADYFSEEYGGEKLDTEFVRQELVDMLGGEACGDKDSDWAVKVLEQFRRMEGGERYYIRRPKEEAGLFISLNRRMFGSALSDSASESLHSEQSISLYTTPTLVSQAEVLSHLLVELQREGVDFSKTVVVLPDENLLFPILREIPEELAKSANVTMGYPLQSTSVFDLVMDWLAYLEVGTEEDHARELEERMRLNPLFRGWLQDMLSQQEGELASTDIAARRRVTDRFFVGLRAQYEGGDTLTSLLWGLHTLASVWTDNTPSIWRAYVHETHGILEDLGRSLVGTGLSAEATPGLLGRLLSKSFALSKLPIKGNVRGGLQIMGFLETRNLDYENVIILSCNEAYLPSGKAAPSFIFESIQRLFGLPSRSDREAMYAYYFHMCISRAQRVHLIYVQNEALELEGEPSRYILQMQYLWGRNDSICCKDYTFSPVPSRVEALCVQKDGDVAAKLARFFVSEGGFETLSPSALKSYIECPMRFYFSRVVRLGGRNREENGEFDASMYGNIVHRTLESLYGDLVGLEGDDLASGFQGLLVAGRIRGEVALQARELMIDEILSRKGQFREEGISLPEVVFNGMQLLQLEVIEVMVGNAIRTDYYSLDAEEGVRLVKILALEQEYNFDLALSEGEGTASRNRRVRIQGIVDRLDLVERENKTVAVRAVDYKTGRLRRGDVTFESVEGFFGGSTASHDRANVLQVMLYCDMVAGSGKLSHFPDLEASDVIPALFHLLPGSGRGERMLDEEKGILQLPGIFSKEGTKRGESRIVDSFAPYRRELLEGLEDKIGELFDFDQPFVCVDTSNAHRCKWCDFRELCCR